MKEEPLHPWIEPELEARITALVLGEASDFEREELEHLIKERAELALFRKRTESLHGLLQEIATGESADDNDDWKLSDEKRNAVLAVIDAKAEKKQVENVLTETVTKPKAKRGNFLRTFTQIAALLFVMALIAGLMIPGNKGVIDYARTRKLKKDAIRSSEKESKLLAALKSTVPNEPVARAAKASAPNYRASSRSALLAIQGNLEQYSQTPEELTMGVAMIEDKLKNIIIPHVEFQDTPLKEALAFLLERSVELDVAEQEPSKKGISFILQADSPGFGAPAAADGGGFDDAAEFGGGVGDTGITLKLSNVPLVTALKYTVSLAQLKYKVEPHAVLVLPLSAPDTDLYTNVYTVPPSFMSAASGGDTANDPFADPADEGGGPARRRTAKDVLLEAGVTFSPGSSVIYNPETSQLIVRNTQDQMELVEAYKDSIKGKAEGLSFPDMNDEALVSNSADMEVGFGMAMKASASVADPFGSGGGGGRAASDPFASAFADATLNAGLTADAGSGGPMVVAVPFAGADSESEMVSADPFAEPSRDGAANMALGKSSSFDDAAPAARKLQSPGEVVDKKIHMGHGQVVTPTVGQLPEIGMLVAEAKAGQDVAIAGGMISPRPVANEQVRIAGKKEASKARKLSKTKSVSPRSQISARRKTGLADAPQKAAGTLRASRSDGFAKTKAKQNADSFADNAPAKSAPPPAAASMPAIQEELAEQDASLTASRGQTRSEFLRQVKPAWELPVPNPNRTTAGVDVSANQRTQDRVSRRKLIDSDSLSAADEDDSMEMVAKKKVTNKESRMNYLPELKNRAELKAPKPTIGRELSAGNRSGQYAVKSDAIDSLVEGEKMSRDAKENKDAAQYEWKRYPGQPATTPLDPVLTSAPKVTARSGRRSVIEQKRELVTAKNGDALGIPEEQTKQTSKDPYRLTPNIVGGGIQPGKPAANEPSDLWYKAYVLMKEGEALEKEQKNLGSYKFSESKKIMDTIAQKHPAFNPQIVNFRRKELEGKVAAIDGIAITAGGSATLNSKKTLNHATPHGKAKPKLIPIKKSAPPTGLNEKNADDEAFSTFSLHVSDVSFKLAQAALAKGEWPDASKVRIEEFVNAFDYGDPMPNQNEKVASQMEQSIHPFLQQRNLLRVSMRTAAAGRSAQTPLRLTFLLDNSGSMERSDRQQTVQRAFALLAQQLQPMDQVTLISFARQPRLLADKVSGSKSNQLVQLVANIPSEGGTNLEAALKLAFEKAREQQIDNAQNRIIMLTDGAANLGNANPENLSKMIEGMRDAGIAFDAAGIGADGLNDEILEALTRKGDGRYYLLDQPEDADEGFARQIAGALRPAAKNVKVQIEFNPNRVGNYKLLGFEKHRLKKEDFRNDKVDAAEMAAEEAGVAVYQFEAKPDGEGDVGSVSVRFRDMSTGQMVENRWPIPYEADAPRIDQAAPSLRIASTAALLAAKLKGEPLGGSVDLQTLSNLISALPNRERNNKRVQELQQMINQARQVSGK